MFAYYNNGGAVYARSPAKIPIDKGNAFRPIIIHQGGLELVCGRERGIEAGSGFYDLNAYHILFTFR